METTALISFIGIIVGVALFIFLSFKAMNLCVAAALGAVVILLFNGGNIYQGIVDFYVVGLANAMKSYFLIFTMGGIFGKIMDTSGGAKAIAAALLKLMRKNKTNPQFFAVYFLVIMYFILTYVGIHGFIIVFTVLPIGRELFHELDIPWRYYCYGSGGCIAAYYLLGSVSSVPSVAASLFGVHVGAAPVLSVIMFLMYLVIDGLWINHDVNSHMKKGEGFFPGGNEIWKLQMESFDENADLPKLWQAVIPMLVMVVLAATGTPTVIALVVGCILGIIFLWNRLKGKVKTTLNTGATSVFVALVNVCGAAALGTVIKNTAGFGFITGVLDNLPPTAAGLLLAFIGTCLLGSSSSSMPAFGEQTVGYFTAAGIPAATGFRVYTCATNLIYPPQNTGVVNASSTGRIAYKDAVKIYLKSTGIPNVIIMVVLIILLATGII
ncbi:MAG: GntP family permease [Oscillospiraceae bacterium]|nr:GntP family permease [Oscillospiraceae bacterium]